jgi:hypothetical protein
MNIKFFLVPVHAQFVFYGQTFSKTSLSTAEDAEGIGHLFDDETEVEPIIKDQSGEDDRLAGEACRESA